MLFHFRICVCFIPLGISVFCCWFLKTHLQVKMLTICHAMQMKYHVSLPSICYDVLYFGSVLKYNHVLFFKKQTEPSKLCYLCHMAHTCIYIWFLQDSGKAAQSSLSSFHFLTYTRPPTVSILGSWLRGNCVLSTFPFRSTIFRVSSYKHREIKWVRKNGIGPQSSVFLRTPLSSLHI